MSSRRGVCEGRVRSGAAALAVCLLGGLLGGMPPAGAQSSDEVPVCSVPGVPYVREILERPGLPGFWLIWGAHASPLGPGCTGEAGFHIEYRVSGTTTWTRSGSVGADEREHYISGLSSGVTYEFAVRAFNSAGVGPRQAGDIERTLSSCDEPQVTASALPGNVLSVTWTHPGGDCAKLGFQVRFKRSTEAVGTYQAIAVDASTRSREIGLGSRTYDVWVLAVRSDAWALTPSSTTESGSASSTVHRVTMVGGL